MKTTKRSREIFSIFLLGRTPEIISRKKAEQDAQTNEILKKYGLNTSSKMLVGKDEDILRINNHDAEAFAIFPYTLQRFAPLIYLAETKKPVVIVSEENTFLYALEAHDYLSDHENVRLVFSKREVKTKIESVEMSKWFDKVKVCIFDAGNWELDGIAWQKNPLIQGRLNTQNIGMQKFLEACENVDREEAEVLAKRWMHESVVKESSLEDVAKSARIYLAMKDAMKEMKANAAYVLWCGQFTKPLGAKMCFSLAKLADEGYPVGCWRGGNLLSLLILHTVSNKPVFTPEALSHRGKIITLRHCFAPGAIAKCKYALQRWRNMKGTVTGYCQLPKGKVTLVNCGIGDKIVVVRGKVLDCKDLKGENCRMTIWVEVENEEAIHKSVGREFAMVYGDYEKKAKKVAEDLGIEVL